MKAINKAFIMPHPPIIIPEIGGGSEIEAFSTIEGCIKAAKTVAEEKPETIVVITPHGPLFRDAVCIGTDDILKGDFGAFGHRSLKYEFKNDMEICINLCKILHNIGVYSVRNNQKTQRSYGISNSVDHGVLVPLYFIQQQYSEFMLVHITYGMLETEELYNCGKAIKEAAENAGRKICIIASADLSHRLTKDAPSGYNAAGKEYDGIVVETIKNKLFAQFLNTDINLRENAGECGHRSINIMLGAFEGRKCETEIYSYEGPFGVGYLAASIEDVGEGASVLGEYRRLKEEKIRNKRKSESEYVKLARRTIERYVKEGKKTVLENAIGKRRGVFVSIKKNGILRGCIGTINPTRDFLENEIIDNAIEAATNDSRFPVVTEVELDDLIISVDILFEPEDITDKSMLDVKEYGVIVSNGYKRGLLLPNLNGIDTVDEQIRIALQKADIDDNEKYKMQRFKVVRHT